MEQGIHYAGFWRRLLAHLIDLLLSLVLFAIPVAYLLVGYPLLPISPSDTPSSPYGTSGVDLLTQLLFIVLVIFFWVRFRGTPGKRLLRCEVVDAESGDNLTIGQATIRYFSYIVSLLPLGLGFLWVVWDPRKQGFHDKIANTLVVQREAGWKPDGEQQPLDSTIKETR